MSNPLRHVRPGEPVKVAASAWNKIVEQVKFHPLAVGEEAAFQRPNFTLRLRNTSTGTVDRWGVMEIAGLLESPSGTTGPGLDSFQSWPGLVGAVPTSTAGGAFAVAVEPIKAGEIGMAAVDGVVQCKLDIQDAGHNYATTKEGSTSELKTASAGEATILWKQSGTGTGKWGLIKIGSGSGRSSIRLGQFTGPWSNDPPGNVKVVQLYKKHPTSTSPNAWIPDEGSFAVTVNLFSYIPTPRGGPTSRWAAVVPLSGGSYTYQTGSYTTVDGVDVPDTATTSTLWLLISAEC